MQSASKKNYSRDPYPYVDSAVGGVNKRNNVIRLDEYAPNGHVDCSRVTYVSPSPSAPTSSTTPKASKAIGAWPRRITCPWTTTTKTIRAKP